jgi:hypothetical protein
MDRLNCLSYSCLRFLTVHPNKVREERRRNWIVASTIRGVPHLCANQTLVEQNLAGHHRRREGAVVVRIIFLGLLVRFCAPRSRVPPRALVSNRRYTALCQSLSVSDSTSIVARKCSMFACLLSPLSVSGA